MSQGESSSFLCARCFALYFLSGPAGPFEGSGTSFALSSHGTGICAFGKVRVTDGVGSARDAPPPARPFMRFSLCGQPPARVPSPPPLKVGAGGGGGAPKGLVHNMLIQFFTLGSSKIEVFKTYFFDIVIT